MSSAPTTSTAHTQQRPSDLAAEHDRPEQGDKADEKQARARRVDFGRGVTRDARHQMRGRDRDGDTDGHVHEEDHAPSQPRQIERDQQPAERESGRSAKPERDAENAEGARSFFVVREQRVDRAEHLRHHQRRRRALHEPRRDQFRARMGKAAPQRTRDEAGQADEEQPPRAEDVAETPACDDDARIGDLIDRDRPLRSLRCSRRCRRGSPELRRSR